MQKTTNAGENIICKIIVMNEEELLNLYQIDQETILDEEIILFCNNPP